MGFQIFIHLFYVLCDETECVWVLPAKNKRVLLLYLNICLVRLTSYIHANILLVYCGVKNLPKAMAEKKKKTRQLTPHRTFEPVYKKYLYQIIICVFVFGLYANSIFNNYNMDDGLVTRNQKYTSQGVKAIPEIITSPYYSDEQGYAYDYRPVVHISYAIENQFFGDNPHIGHFFNIVFYIVCCILLYNLLRKLLSVSDWIILTAVMIFAAHPVHTEVVCSLKNRDELLAMLFAFLSFDLYRRFYENGKWYNLLAGLLLITLSFLSKLSSASYAAFIPIVFLLLKEQKPVRAMLISAITAFVVVLVQPEGTLGSKFSTMMLLVLPVAAVLVLQNLKLIIAFLIKLCRWSLHLVSDKISATRATFRLPVIKKSKIQTNRYEVSPVQSYYLFGDEPTESSPTGITSYIWVIVILGLVPVSFLIGSFMGIYLTAVILAAFFVLKRGLQKWLAFCMLGIYMYVLVYAFPQLQYFFLPFAGLFFVIGMFQPGWRYVLAGFLLFLGLYIECIVLGYEKPFNVFEILVLFTLFVIRRKYGRFVAFTVIGIVAVYLVVLFTGGAKGSDSGFHFIGYPALLQVLFFAAVISTGFYLAYKKIDFSTFTKILLALIVLSLIGNTLMFNVDYGKYFLGNEFTFGLFYSDKALGSQELTGIAHRVPGDVSNAAHSLKNMTVKISQVQNKISSSKINVLPVATDRPLLLLEAPVTLTDPLNIRIGTSMVVLLHYAKLMVLPHPLSFYYGYRVFEPTPLGNWKAIVGLLLYFALAFVALINISRNKILSVGLFGYLLGIVLFANFNNLIPGVAGDRYLFFPSVGFCFIIIATIQYYAERKKIGNVPLMSLPKGFKYGFGLVLLLLSIKTWSRNLDWKDNITLFRHDLKNVPESAQAHNLLALELMQASANVPNPAEQTQMRQEALTEFKKTLEIYPEFFNATFDAGRTYMLLGVSAHQAQNANEEKVLADSAIIYFKRGIALNPGYTVSHQNIADIYMGRGSWQEAIPYLHEAVRIRPADYSGYDKLSYAYFQLKQYDSSLAVNRTAIIKVPGSAEPVINIGRTYLGMNQPDSARYYLRKAAILSPGNSLVQQLLQQLGN
ncbi:MAG: hypothetical protein JWO06_3637 [Bacteroidota bacterium]|nr:hypothetical protein [Bacteroidota bacterium]